MTIYIRYECKDCGSPCYPMDMHNKEICKVCWLKEFKSKFKGRITNYRKNKLLLGSG